MRRTVFLVSVIFSVLSASTSLAQNLFFEETFDGGIPTTWANMQLGVSSDLWVVGSGQVNGTPDVYHEWFCDNGFSFRDTILLSPPINLSGLSQASFSCEQFQHLVTSMHYNKIEVTTDGGQTYTVIKDLAGSPEGFSTVTASMNAFAGLPSVQVALRYKGAVANNWWADNVRVLTPQPVYSLSALVAGTTAHFEVRGVPPGSTAAIGLSAGPGPTPSGYGALNMSLPIERLPHVVADQTGVAALDFPIPLGTAGTTIHSQAVVLFPGGGFDLSNSLAATVQ